MNIRWRVELSQDEREELTALLKSGRHAVRKVKRAQILLAADDGVGDGEVAARVGAGGSTVYRTKRRFVEGNLELALVEARAPRRSAQAERQGGGAADRHRLLGPAGGPRALDARAAGRRHGRAHRA